MAGFGLVYLLHDTKELPTGGVLFFTLSSYLKTKQSSRCIELAMSSCTSKSTLFSNIWYVSKNFFSAALFVIPCMLSSSSEG